MHEEAWPALPLAAWNDTCETLHMISQIVGKVRLALSPPEPQWAQVALYVTPRGLTTGTIPFGNRTFSIGLDLTGHTIDFKVSDGQLRSLALRAQTVAEYYRQILDALHLLGIDVRIWPMPVEVPNPIRFDRDTTHASYDQEFAKRFHTVLVLVDSALREHRAPFRRRHTLVQFFFGSFDIAYARFSGRPATPPNDDPIFVGAMDAQEICVGFWPGDARFPEPVFWAYAYPKPPGAEAIALQPKAAFWSDAMGEFMLRYEDVRTAPSPRDALRQFFASTFDGLSRLAKWDDV